MTTTAPTRTWWDARGDVIHFMPFVQDGRHVAAHDAALANLLGGPADGRAAVMLRGPQPPVLVGKPLKGIALDGRPVLAWYRREDAPPKLTYRFMFTSPSWPGAANLRARVGR